MNINTLDERRDQFGLNFPIQCTKNKRTKDMFLLKTKVHSMITEMMRNDKFRKLS